MVEWPNEGNNVPKELGKLKLLISPLYRALGGVISPQKAVPFPAYTQIIRISQVIQQNFRTGNLSKQYARCLSIL